MVHLHLIFLVLLSFMNHIEVSSFRKNKTRRQDGLDFPSSRQKPIASCFLDTGERGLCRRISECKTVLENWRQVRPTICGWEPQGNMPQVCCVEPTIATQEMCARALGNETVSSFRIKRQVVSLLPFPLRPNKNRSESSNTTTLNAKTPLVVNGTRVLKDSRPWMAAIFKRIRADLPLDFKCGASLIGTQHVLTAAHCFLERRIDASDYVIFLGSTQLNLTSDKVPVGGRWENVEKIIIHPDFKAPSLYNDIAIMKLEKPISFSNNVRPICLPGDGLRSVQFSGVNSIVMGWGTTDVGGAQSETLLEAMLPVVPNNKCNEAYSKLRRTLANYPDGITSTLLCAGYDDIQKDACQGDSGGPLFWPSPSHERWILIGIVSSGFMCAVPGFPGIYTRVTSHLDWISQNIA